MLDYEKLEFMEEYGDEIKTTKNELEISSDRFLNGEMSAPDYYCIKAIQLIANKYSENRIKAVIGATDRFGLGINWTFLLYENRELFEKSIILTYGDEGPCEHCKSSYVYYDFQKPGVEYTLRCDDCDKETIVIKDWSDKLFIDGKYIYEDNQWIRYYYDYLEGWIGEDDWEDFA